MRRWATFESYISAANIVIQADTHVHVSRVVRSLEVSVIPSIRMLACEMLNAISHAYVA